MKVLTSERDRLSDLHEEAKEELQRARHDFVRKTPTKSASGPSLAATHVLRRVEDVSTVYHLMPSVFCQKMAENFRFYPFILNVAIRF